ncbi:MAG TPA: ribosome maturation factor RimM [Solirubrobacteraceae bacterium]|nr:ribosome maturation factor RimM [Solirubrobacteraceae bacterium]
MSDERSTLDAGRVGRPHGLDGSFYVTGPVPRLLRLGASVQLRGHAVEIVRRSGTEQRPILRLEGIEGRAAAEALRGERLTVPTEQAPRLEEGEFWAHELEGCEVLAGERVLGTVARLVELPSCEALELRPGPGQGDGQRPGQESGQQPPALLVPMVRDAVRRINIEGRRIEIDADFLGLEAGDGA